jgi:hypothetical protein
MLNLIIAESRAVADWSGIGYFFNAISYIYEPGFT